jgi:hypothetical protein
LYTLLLSCLLGSLAWITSCNKDKNLVSIDGTVTDPNTGINVEGATVVFSCTKITDGVYNSGYTEVARTTTDASGKFYFEMEEERASGYRIALSKPGYFSTVTDISGTNLVAGTPYSQIFQIFPVGYIKLHVTNFTPVNSDDIVSYTFSSGWLGCYECCDNTLRFGYGEDVDVWLKCKTYGNQNVTISWNVTKNFNTMAYNANVYCIANDTVTYQIFY